jgi:hypothetical protein
MRTVYGGPMPTAEMFQAIWQDQGLFDRHNINHVKEVYLYFTACDETGRKVVPLDDFGHPIEDLRSPGAYRSAADEYDREQELESQPAPRKGPPPPKPSRSIPFSPL